MYYLYILKSENNRFYTGITINLEKRLCQHRAKIGADFTKRFDDLDLVYTETFLVRKQAEKRELQIKGWSTKKKQALINRDYERLKQLSMNADLVEGMRLGQKNGEPVEP